MEACEASLGWFYNGLARTDQRNICPSGWHVPTPLDWSQLAGNTLGSSLTVNGMSGIDLDKVNLFYNWDTGQPDCVEVDYNSSYGIYGAQYNVPPPGVTAFYTTVVAYSNSPFFEWENNTPELGLWCAASRIEEAEDAMREA